MPAGERLLLAFPRACRPANVKTAPALDTVSSVPLPSLSGGKSENEERDVARSLLAESADKAERFLAVRDLHASGKLDQDEENLRTTILVARQLMANPDILIADLLNYQADIEAGVQRAKGQEIAERDLALQLLGESAEKAEQFLDLCANGAPSVEGQNLRTTILVARQLMANLDISTADLLNYQADIEAGVQRAKGQEIAERELALLLLAESAEKAECCLEGRDLRACGAPCQEEENIRITLLVARQLMANPGTLTADLLNYQADIEAGVQLLAAPVDLEALRRDLVTLQTLVRGAVLTPEAVEVRRRLMAALTVAAGSPEQQALADDFAALCTQMDSVPAAPSRTNADRFGGDVEIHSGVSGSEVHVDGSPYGSGVLVFQEWNEEDLDDMSELVEVLQDVEHLASAHRQLSELVAASVEGLDATEASTAVAVDNSQETVRELGKAAKTKAKGWTAKGSFGGAAVGAAVGVCVAGPVGAVVGAGISAGVGAIGGKAAKKYHNKAVDQAVAAVDTRTQ